ncbi:NeuD/PglB/VioB family sugar acetyltransferase [Cryobacterium luteum]|uniref:Acetyltransferase n=1 Tax=Cryobacterium luteum TaxID=1424661 RepID=A0A1H8CE57_9MICO|nr:NeuD/PglB/VioB family sugar acetyltransferase [Cryobacterium luteum]TFB89340.1 acetyltransferase [Cryobacterium luteum]SEM93189.1 sugar O-acyltransferase, sialic acid O-acetyltransferase NeuD family [Cryobacterium luteum]
MTELLLIGASGLAREVLSVLHENGDARSVAIVDDQAALTGTSLDGALVVGGLTHVARHPTAQLLVCVGNGAARAALVERLTGQGITPDRYATLVHPAAVVPTSCRVGTGSILLACVVLTADVHLGNHVVIMPNVTLTHGNRVESFATLCAGVAVGGDAHIGVGAYIGMNASIRERTRIGAAAVIGMGAAVLADVPSAQTWVGVPAQRMLATARPNRSGAGARGPRG